VTSPAQLSEFIAFPLGLHDRERYVPQLSSVIRSWWRGTSAHPEPVSLVLVRDDSGAVVARSTVHTDRRFDERVGATNLLFGATEFASPEAAAALFGHLEDLARSRGVQQLLGPVSLLPNQAGGVITSGFDERGFVDSAWNPSSVPAAYEAAGFERWNESDTWVVDIDPTAVTRVPTAAEWADAGVRLELGARKRINALIPELLTLLNAAFSPLPYYTQITPSEMAAATDGLAYLLDENLLLLARDGSGDAVAFVLVIPDITLFLQKTGGTMGPLQQLRLLATRGKYRTDAILVIQGTRPDKQGNGILTLLSRQLQANLAAGGYARLRSTYVGRDNAASAHQFSRFGGTVLHGYTFYRRAVAAAPGLITRTDDRLPEDTP